PARPACWPEPGSRRKSPDQPRQRLRIIAAADPHPVTARQLDLDVVLGGRCRRSRPGLRDDLYGQKPRLLCWARNRGGVRRITGIAQPLEDQVRVHRVAPRHLSHGNARRRRLETDRTLLLIRPKSLRPTRHAITIVSAIYGGHDPPLSTRGSAVRPDAYGAGGAQGGADYTSRRSAGSLPRHSAERSSDLRQEGQPAHCRP